MRVFLASVRPVYSKEREGNMPIRSLFGKTYETVERSLDIAKRRHGIIASNVANMNTPGYNARDLDFDKALGDALEKRSIGVSRTHPLHLGARMGTVDYGGAVTEHSGVDIDKEMSRLAENNLRYQTGVELLLRKFTGLKHAIAEGGR